MKETKERDILNVLLNAVFQERCRLFKVMFAAFVLLLLIITYVRSRNKKI